MTNDQSTAFTTGSGDDAQSLKNEAVALKDKATDRLAQEADSRKEQVAGGMKQVSNALESAASDLDGGETPDWLKQGFAKVASSVNSLASELEASDSRELTRKVQDFARRSPGTFLGACAAAGFAAARVFTAGQSDDSGSGSQTAQRFGGSTTGMDSTDTMSRPYGQDTSYGAGSGGGSTMTGSTTGDAATRTPESAAGPMGGAS